MNFSYPFYDTNSPYYESKKLWTALELSTAGGFTLGGNGFWHGGVHFESSAGIPEDRAIRAIADGEVVAYRLNKEYLKKDAETQAGTEYEYSTGFVLIKHTYQSLFGVDAQGTQTQDRNELEFYSLYMHLKPYSEYDNDLKGLFYCEGEEVQYKVTDKAVDGGGGLNMRPTPGGNPAITQLPVKTQVKLSSLNANNWGQVSEIVSGYDDYEGDLGWIYVGNNETEKFTIPNQFDSVRPATEDIKDNGEKVKVVKAGEIIGYMGKYDAPASATNGRKQLHLEIFTTATQAEIVAFLSNNANVNLPESHDLYKIEQNSPFASMQQEPATEGLPAPAPTFTELAETHFQNVLVNSRTLKATLKTDASGNKWLPLSATTHTTDNKKESLASKGWVKVTGSDPSHWPGFDNPPLDGIADGVGYYKKDAPSTLMTTLIKHVEPSYVSGAETPIVRTSYVSAAKQLIAKDAVSRSIIKHKVEWSSTYTADLMAIITSEELIPDAEKKTRFQERKEELDFWEEVTGMGTSEAYYFHPLAFIDNMMRMEAYYEAVIHVTSEIKTAIVLNTDGTVNSSQSWDYGGYNDLENGYTVNSNIYSKKMGNDYSWFPTFKGYIYRGIGSEAKAKLSKDLENNNRNLAEEEVLEFARHTKYEVDENNNITSNRDYNTGNPVPPTADNKYFEVKFRLSSTYRYRISTPKEEFPAAFSSTTNAGELQTGPETIVKRTGANTKNRLYVSFDPWKSTSLEGCLGVMDGSGGYAINMKETKDGVTKRNNSKHRYISVSLFLENKVPELKGIYGRLYASASESTTAAPASYVSSSGTTVHQWTNAPEIPAIPNAAYDKHTRVWLKIDSLPDVDYIMGGGE